MEAATAVVGGNTVAEDDAGENSCLESERECFARHNRGTLAEQEGSLHGGV